MFPTMTVAENISSTPCPARTGLIDFAKMNRESAVLLDALGSNISPSRPLSRL